MTLRPEIKDQKPWRRGTVGDEPEHFAVIAHWLLEALRPKEHPMPTPDHYADLVAEYGKDNDYEQLALNALRLADDSSDEGDRPIMASAAITFALLHLARTGATQQPAAYTIRGAGPGQWTARPDGA